MKIYRFYLLIFILFHFGWSQDASKLVVTIPGDAIATANGVLKVQDSSGAYLAIGQVQVNGTAYWLKKSNTPPRQGNVVHYWFDDSTKTLSIYFSARDLTHFQGETISIEIVGMNGSVKQPLIVRSSDGRPIPTSQ